jgi:starch phosphorylase
VEELWANGYNPFDYYIENEELKCAIDWLGSGHFTPSEEGILAPLRNNLLDGGDPYLVLADFEGYCRAQHAADLAYRDPLRWARMSLMNTARLGKFSSDRTIAEYARDIWNLNPVPVPDSAAEGAACSGD